MRGATERTREATVSAEATKATKQYATCVRPKSMKLIVANWKAYVATAKEAEHIAKNVAQIKTKKGIAVVVCPPFVFLDAVKKKIGRTVRCGAQDVFWKKSGPYTGAITADMLKGLGVSSVIIGHSERRQHFSESDEIICKKTKTAPSPPL